MNSRPPRIATWLLSHFGSVATNESLRGDLTEEYARGHTRAWYWRRVLLAIVIGFWTEVSTHRLLALRAVAIGWTVLLLQQRFLSPIIFNMALYQLWWQLRRGSPLVFVFSELAPIILWAPAFAIAGWIVGRLHRPHHAVMVLLFATSNVVWGCQRLPGVYHLFLNSLDNSRYLPYLVGVLFGLVVNPMCILLGGLLSAPKIGNTVEERRVTT